MYPSCVLGVVVAIALAGVCFGRHSEKGLVALATIQPATHSHRHGTRHGPQAGWTLPHDYASCSACRTGISRPLPYSLALRIRCRRASVRISTPLQTRGAVQIFTEAKDLLPGGVNSPVRAFNSVGGQPIVFDKVKGATITDVDGNEYIDYVGTWGPAIVGHANDEVLEAVKAQLDKGASYGAPCELENTMAKMVIERVPCVEMVRAAAPAPALARSLSPRLRWPRSRLCCACHPVDCACSADVC